MMCVSVLSVAEGSVQHSDDCSVILFCDSFFLPWNAFAA